MIQSYNADIFQRIHSDVLEIKNELEKQPQQDQGHEWVDIDDYQCPDPIRSYEYKYKKEQKK